MKTKILFIFFMIFSYLIQTCYSQETWTTTSFNSAPSPRLLQTAVFTGTKMIVWGGQSDNKDVKTGGVYNISNNSWQRTDTNNAPAGRELHTAIWTGSKMIVWGGLGFDGPNFNIYNSGGIYDPLSDSWTETSLVNAPSARTWHNAVWTGSKMIIWGGIDNTGGIFDPVTNSWSEMSTINAPVGRDRFSAVWTGTKMIIWGGEILVDTLQIPSNSGGIYDPVTDTWATTSLINAPSPREQHTAVWTGSKMIIWGWGEAGGIYDPITDSWVTMSTVNSPNLRSVHTAVWTGLKMIIWGGLDSNNILNSGDIYNPLTDSWSQVLQSGAPVARYYHNMIWTGSKMIVWGGEGNNGPLYSGGIYSNPSVIAVQNISNNIPLSFSLYQNFPNPFNPSTTIKFDLPKDGNITIEIYDMLGRVVATLAKSEFKHAGSYQVEWDASGFSSGVYFYRLQAGEYTATKKMILIK